MPFTCPRCGRTSHNPNDAAQNYCSNCKVFLDDAPGPRTHTDAQALDQIAAVLNTRAWDFEAVRAVAAAVRGAGRGVDDVNVERELGQLKTVMDAIRRASKNEPE